MLILLIVLVIVGLMYTLRSNDGKTIVEQRRDMVGKAQDVLLQSRLARIREALNLYFTDHGEYPDHLDLLVPDYIRNRLEINDPWDKPFRLERDETLTNIIHSAGPDGSWDTKDDIWRQI